MAVLQQVEGRAYNLLENTIEPNILTTPHEKRYLAETAANSVPTESQFLKTLSRVMDSFQSDKVFKTSRPRTGVFAK